MLRSKVSTSFVERFNLTMRMSVRRYSHKANGISKTTKNHKNMPNLFMVYYNFIRLQETLSTMPTLATSNVSRLRAFEWPVGKIDRILQRDRQWVRSVGGCCSAISTGFGRRIYRCF